MLFLFFKRKLGTNEFSRSKNKSFQARSALFKFGLNRILPLNSLISLSASCNTHPYTGGYNGENYLNVERGP